MENKIIAVTDNMEPRRNNTTEPSIMPYSKIELLRYPSKNNAPRTIPIQTSTSPGIP